MAKPATDVQKRTNQNETQTARVLINGAPVPDYSNLTFEIRERGSNKGQYEVLPHSKGGASAALPPFRGDGGIAVIDNAHPATLLNKKIGEKASLSHADTVISCILKKNLSSFYNVGNKEGTWDTLKMFAALEHIADTHKKSGVSVVSISASADISYVRLNEIARRSAQPNEYGLLPLTPDNIRERSGFVKQILEREVGSADFGRAARLALGAGVRLNRLIDNGVIPVLAAGNYSDSVSLWAVLSPNAIVVAESEFGEPGRLVKSSSRSTLNDTSHQGFALLRFPGQTIEQSAEGNGTSFAAPRVANEVAALSRRGMSVSQINELYAARERLAAQNPKNEIALVDAEREVEAYGLYGGEMPRDVLLEMDTSDGFEALKIMHRALPNNAMRPAQVAQLLSLARAARGDVTMSFEDLSTLFKKFAEVDVEKHESIICDAAAKGSTARDYETFVRCLMKAIEDLRSAELSRW